MSIIVKFNSRYKSFIRSVESTAAKAILESGKRFEEEVRIRTPMASSKYVNAGKLKAGIKADGRVTKGSNIVLTNVTSTAKTADKRKRSYGFFVEFGTVRTPAFAMFRKAAAEEFNEILYRYIYESLRKLV